MPIDVIMPKVDMVMDEGTIVHWYHAEGDAVTVGQPLFDIETDKSTMVIEAPGSGVLGPISAPVDTTVPVATVIATILQPGEKAQSDSQKPIPSAVLEAPSNVVQPLTANNTTLSSTAAPRPRATPIARKLANDHGLDLGSLSGSGPKGRIGKIDVLQAIDTIQATPQVAGNGKSPSNDDRTYVEPTTTVPQVAPASFSEMPQPNPQPAPDIEGKLIPLAGVRRIVAQRMTLSTAIPQFTLSIDVRMSAAKELRNRLVYRPSITAILARAIAALLPRHPTLNASFRDDGVWLHTPVHLGIALDTDGDLLVPVIRNAHQQSLQNLDAALRDMRKRAEAKQLPPNELQGSTFTISNLGMFGIDQFTALVNPPEAAILAVGRVADRPVQMEGALQFEPMMTLTLSADHRVTDGATAARFLQDLRAAIEEPYLML